MIMLFSFRHLLSTPMLLARDPRDNVRMPMRLHRAAGHAFVAQPHPLRPPPRAARRDIAAWRLATGEHRSFDDERPGHGDLAGAEQRPRSALPACLMSPFLVRLSRRTDRFRDENPRVFGRPLRPEPETPSLQEDAPSSDIADGRPRVPDRTAFAAIIHAAG
jgi:hypothetical protein